MSDPCQPDLLSDFDKAAIHQRILERQALSRKVGLQIIEYLNTECGYTITTDSVAEDPDGVNEGGDHYFDNGHGQVSIRINSIYSGYPDIKSELCIDINSTGEAVITLLDCDTKSDEPQEIFSYSYPTTISFEGLAVPDAVAKILLQLSQNSEMTDSVELTGSIPS